MILTWRGFHSKRRRLGYSYWGWHFHGVFLLDDVVRAGVSFARTLISDDCMLRMAFRIW